MNTNPTKTQGVYYRQDFAFSTNYLDYEIPDFRGRLARTVPMVVMPAPIVVPVQPVFAWGFAPPIGVGIWARPGWGRPWGWGGARPFAFARPGGRGIVR